MVEQVESHLFWDLNDQWIFGDPAVDKAPCKNIGAAVWDHMDRRARAFRERVGGIMPGYSGHHPGAREPFAGPSQGGVPFKMEQDHTPGQGHRLDNRPTTTWTAYVRGGDGEKMNQVAPSGTDIFRGQTGGVKLG